MDSIDIDMQEIIFYDYNNDHKKRPLIPQQSIHKGERNGYEEIKICSNRL